MPGIFSPCIISTRPGLSHDDRSLRRRRRGFDSISVGSTSTRSDSMASWTDSGSFSLKKSRSRINEVPGRLGPGTSAPPSRGFYSNKETKAMVFASNNSEQRGVLGGLQSQQLPTPKASQRKRRILFSRPSEPCEWGYFVDTAV